MRGSQIRMAKKKKKPVTGKIRPMKRLKKSTGWIKATAVKLVRHGGHTDVLIQKSRRRKS